MFPSLNGPELLARDLGDFSPKPTTVTPGQVEASALLWRSADGQVSMGLWECTEGRFTARRDEGNEICHILRGRVTLIHPDSRETDHGPGDLFVLPQGWVGSWVIHERTRKIYTFQTVTA
ncbi:cupin domain-containing protein [Microvirga pakistanensis]|uniref:cupin domain-containing protein n=1 Tax=Microvirga pakistanensis TaxID=1682650 RepID=UPI00106D787A|nr:cupin domain-containing protein [Microvirga pakistanensis]